MTTYFDNQATIKALRDSGVPNTPALNSKAITLQVWLDSYNRKQSTVEEVSAVPAVDLTEELEGLDPIDEMDAQLIAYYQSAEYAERKVFMAQMTPEQRYEFTLGNLACDIDQPELFKNESTDNEVFLYGQACELPALTLSNFEGIDQETMQVTDWQTAVPLTCDICNYQAVTLPIPSPVPTVAPVPINHGEVGIALCLIMLEAWRVVAFLLIPLIAQSYLAVRKIAISTTLAVEGFKSAALLAKKSLQIA